MPRKARNEAPFQKVQPVNPQTNSRSATNPEVTRILMEYKDRRNNFTLGLFRRIESLGDSLIDKTIEMAMQGNEKLMMFLLEKSVNNNLINRLEKPLLSKTVADIDNSQQLVIEKMGEGTLDVGHGMNLVKTLSIKRDTINVRLLEEQVQRIVGDE